ncbi:MAG TPA: hypothetical protein VM680_17610, partial [Verrucomicrobiae bacterium]|nr:hypothetical protein [Verrucomicrobiae bacterium]
MHLRSSGKIFCARIILALAFAFSAPAQSLDKFEFSTITTDKVAFVPFRVLISARSSTGALVRGYTGTPSLTASLDGFPIPIEALSKFQFTNGQWSGNLVFTKPGNGVIITVSGNARTNSTAPLNVAPPNFRVLNLPVISLASDLTRGVLYASIGPTNAGFGIINTIDPATGDTIATHNVFGGVERIELTDDASKLYVVSEDQLKVRRLRLPDFEEEAIISLGESEPGVPNYARDVAAHPTDPNTVAIVKGRRNLSPWYIGFSVFEGTVEKKISNQFFSSATVLHWGEKPNRLYGHDNQTSPTDFTQFDVGDTEIVPVASRRNLLNFFFGDIEVSAGKLYCSTGRIIDPEALTLLGELPNGHQDAVMLASPERKRIVYFTPAALGLMTTFDSDTLQALGSEPFPMPRGYGSGAAFWGNNGIALHDTKRLYLIENELLPSIAATADLQVTAGASQPAAEVAVDHQLKAFVKNLGPDAATSVLIRVSGPVDTVLSAATVAGRNATTTITDRSIRLEFDSLAPSEEVEVRFIARSAVAAWQPFGVIATSAAIDPNGTNSSANVLLKAAPLPAGDSQLTLRLGTTDVVADRGRGTILVAASGSMAPNANSIIAINPSTGDVSQPVLVGSRPVRLAISDDGSFLYVGFQGIAEVRRFNLPDLQPSLTIPLGREGFSGPYFGNYIAVRPGHPSDIAVARSTHSAASTTAQPEQFAYYHDATEIRPDRGTPHLLEFVDADH